MEDVKCEMKNYECNTLMLSVLRKSAENGVFAPNISFVE